MFKLKVNKMYWLEPQKDDLCVHGIMTVILGEKTYEYDATVTAASLYLLKAIFIDHNINQGEQIMPCCGFSIYPTNKSLTEVEIFGCDNGIDFQITHHNDKLTISDKDNYQITITLDEYKKEVYQFVDQIEAFYQADSPKNIQNDKFTQEAYQAFWYEWHYLRNR